MANVEKLKVLRNDLKELDPKKFEYASLFDDRNYEKWYDKKKLNAKLCGTVGCVAGWTCLLYCPKQTEECLDPISAAATYLELDKDERFFLFLDRVFDGAGLKDALNRLNWLIAGKKIDGYDFSKESWMVKKRQRLKKNMGEGQG